MGLVFSVKDLVKKYIGNKAVKASLGYTIGNYLLKGIGFITVPIFARLMTQEDFGNYNTFLAYEGIIYLFISLALHVTLKNAKYEYGEDNLDGYTSSISIIPLIVISLFLVIANVFFGHVGSILNLDRFQTNLLLIYCYASGVLIYYHNRLALDYQYKQYLGISYVNTFLHIAISLILMVTVFSEQRYMARIIGSVFSLSIVTIYILINIWRKAAPKINLTYWKFGLKLGLPIIPHGIGQVVLLSFDRIMINRYVGAKEAGIYSFAYTVFTIIQITSSSLSTVFEPWAYQKLSDKKNDEVKKRATQFFYLMCCLCSAVILIAPELILLLGSEKYAGSIYCVIPIMVGGVFSMAYMIPSTLTYYCKKTQYIAIGTIGAAALNILLNYVFIVKYGYIAAAYTTLACYIAYYLFHTIIAERVSGIRIIKIKSSMLGFGSVVAVSALTFLTLHLTWARITVLLFIVVIVGGYLLKKYMKGSMK